MRNLFSLACLLLILSQTNYAQTAIQLKQLKIFEDACKIYADSENYKELVITASQGFTLASLLHQNKDINLFSNYAARAYSMVNKPDSVLHYNYAALATAYSIQSEENIAKANIGLADTYYELGKPDSVKKYQQIINNEVHTFKDSTVIITLYKELADIYSYDNAYEKCLTAYANVLRYYEHHNDSRNIAIALVNMGNDYLQMSNSAKALSYFLRAMPLLNDYALGQLICSINTGAAYTNLEMYDSALVYDKISMHVAEKLKDTGDVFAAYEKIGAAYIGKKDYNKAEQYLKPALQYYQQTAFERGIIDGEEFMGELEIGRGNYKPAINYFSDALEKSKQSNYPERINELYKKLAETTDSAKLYEQSVYYYKQYLSYSDSLSKESNEKTMAELEEKYQTQQREQQINLLNQKANTQELSLQSQRNKTIFFITALILISVIIVIYIRYRNRLNQLKKLTEVRNNISRDLHDEIGSTLSSINIYSEVAKNKLIHNNDVQILLQRINEGSAQMMESMSDIVWYVNPKNDVAANTIIRMREYAAPVLEAKQINLQFNVDEKVNSVKFSMQQRQHFYLLFKEAINNIAKYAQAKNAIVTIEVINQNINLSIADDGKGFNLNDHKEGNGLTNIQQRTIFLKGICNIKSVEGNGTTIEVNFPGSL